MKVLVKAGVIIGEINARLFHVCITVSSVFGDYGVVAVLTCGRDGKHMVGSLHPKDLAWDFRLWNLPEAVRKEAVDKIRDMLDIRNNDYDVLLESKITTGADGKPVKLEWMHIEYQPKIKREV